MHGMLEVCVSDFLKRWASLVLQVIILPSAKLQKVHVVNSHLFLILRSPVEYLGDVAARGDVILEKVVDGEDVVGVKVFLREKQVLHVRDLVEVVLYALQAQQVWQGQDVVALAVYDDLHPSTAAFRSGNKEDRKSEVMGLG